MTNISGPVKTVHHHSDRSQPTAAYPASVVDFFEAGCLRLSGSEGTGKEAAMEQGHRRAVYWLISLAALISLLVGVPCLLESAKPRTAGADQLDRAAQGTPNQVEVTIDQAIQALGVQH
jgi:hypothetical protein